MRLKQTQMCALAPIKSNQSILELIQRTLFHVWETVYDRKNEETQKFSSECLFFKNKNHQPGVNIHGQEEPSRRFQLFSIISVHVYTSCAAICLLARRGLTRSQFFSAFSRETNHQLIWGLSQFLKFLRLRMKQVRANVASAALRRLRRLKNKRG